MTNHSILGNKLNQKTFVKHETWLDSVDLTEWCIIEPEKEFSHANLQVNFVKWTRCHLPGDNYRILILVAFLLFRKLWKASQKRFRFYFKRLATRKSWEPVDGLHEFVLPENERTQDAPHRRGALNEREIVEEKNQIKAIPSDNNWSYTLKTSLLSVRANTAQQQADQHTDGAKLNIS